MYKSFRPGKVWYDTAGKRIQAHGGSVMYADGIFYWYGENKEGITGTATGEQCTYWHHGVRLYSSADLYNWTDEGIIMLETQDKTHPFYPANLMDRPHILYNACTKKYVLWAKTSLGDFQHSFFSVCIADTIRGPFKLCEKVDCSPYHAGDFDLIEENGTAYIIYENPHSEMICQTLSNDYTRFGEGASSHLPCVSPPYTREAPAFFARNGRKFLLTSGTTGYYPNASQLDEITCFHDAWKTLGNPCVGDKNNNSFHAQFSSVFKHPHIKDLYIALGDRWLTDLPMDLPDVNEIFYRLCNKDAPPLPRDFNFARLSAENTSEADYVWLPVRFHPDGMPYIEWRTEWTIENFNE